MASGDIIRKIKYYFYNAQSSVYITRENNMANLYRDMEKLKRIAWFKRSVRNIRAFRIEDWSDFTDVLKE